MNVISYNRGWTEDAIDEIREEINLLSEIEDKIRILLNQSDEDITINYNILRDVNVLEDSLKKTVRALEIYMNENEKNISKATALYENELSKKSSINK